jgi:hypothetical protein
MLSYFSFQMNVKLKDGAHFQDLSSREPLEGFPTPLLP